MGGHLFNGPFLHFPAIADADLCAGRVDGAVDLPLPVLQSNDEAQESDHFIPTALPVLAIEQATDASLSLGRQKAESIEAGRKLRETDQSGAQVAL